MTTLAPDQAERVELILQQIDALPTLSPIATRLLRLSSGDDADAREIIALVESDPTLTSRLLSLCRRSTTGLGASVATVDRAVLMLGFDAVRSALLGVHMFEIMGDAGDRESAEADNDGAGPAIDRPGLWRHLLGVACAAERIAEAHRGKHAGLKPDEAFVCGLLHDLGKISLHLILPRAYARVVRLAERDRSSLDEAERRVLGIDHHTAGKRLAEHWGLPHQVQDVMWLHGQRYDALPDLPHRRMIGVVTVADALARKLHIGWSGNRTPPPDIDALARQCGLDPQRVAALAATLHETVAARAESLGLEEIIGDDLQLQSIVSANQELVRLNTALERRSAVSSHHARALATLGRFFAEAGGRTLLGVLADVSRSACDLLGPGRTAIAFQARPGEPWQFCRFGRHGEPEGSKVCQPPSCGVDLSALLVEIASGSTRMDLAAWLAERIDKAFDPSAMRLLPLPCRGGPAALLVHERPVPEELRTAGALDAVVGAWSTAIAGAAQHDGARRLGERLAEANRSLAESQDRLMRAQSLMRLGAMASGAAHEMNNPLAIISGRAQLLARKLKGTEEAEAALAVATAALRLSNLISGLHFFADPPRPSRRNVDLTELIGRIVRDVRAEQTKRGVRVVPVRLRVEGPLPPAYVDPNHITCAVSELIKNALEARPRSFVEVGIHTEGADGRLSITVKDDGQGMTEQALEHAFDPFFSEKPSGRQTGLGLAKAHRMIEQHGGSIELSSALGHGTTATISLESWRKAEVAPPKAAAAA